MADADKLLLAYAAAEERHRQESHRYFPVWSVGRTRLPTAGVVTEEVLLHLKKLGDQGEAARQAWLSALEDERRQRQQSN